MEDSLDPPSTEVFRRPYFASSRSSTPLIVKDDTSSMAPTDRSFESYHTADIHEEPDSHIGHGGHSLSADQVVFPPKPFSPPPDDLTGRPLSLSRFHSVPDINLAGSDTQSDVEYERRLREDLADALKKIRSHNVKLARDLEQQKEANATLRSQLERRLSQDESLADAPRPSHSPGASFSLSGSSPRPFRSSLIVDRKAQRRSLHVTSDSSENPLGNVVGLTLDLKTQLTTAREDLSRTRATLTESQDHCAKLNDTVLSLQRNIQECVDSSAHALHVERSLRVDVEQELGMMSGKNLALTRQNHSLEKTISRLRTALRRKDAKYTLPADFDLFGMESNRSSTNASSRSGADMPLSLEVVQSSDEDDSSCITPPPSRTYGVGEVDENAGVADAFSRDISLPLVIGETQSTDDSTAEDTDVLESSTGSTFSSTVVALSPEFSPGNLHPKVSTVLLHATLSKNDRLLTTDFKSNSSLHVDRTVTFGDESLPDIKELELPKFASQNNELSRMTSMKDYMKRASTIFYSRNS